MANPNKQMDFFNQSHICCHRRISSSRSSSKGLFFGAEGLSILLYQTANALKESWERWLLSSISSQGGHGKQQGRSFVAVGKLLSRDQLHWGKRKDGETPVKLSLPSLDAS